MEISKRNILKIFSEIEHINEATVGSGVILNEPKNKDYIYVLTAWHCIYEYKDNEGNEKCATKEQIVKLYAKHKYDDKDKLLNSINAIEWIDDKDNDISIIKFNREDLLNLIPDNYVEDVVILDNCKEELSLISYGYTSVSEEIVEYIFSECLKKETNNPRFTIKTEPLTNYKGGDSQSLIAGFSGSGVFLKQTNYLIGIVLENPKTIGANNLTCTRLNSLLQIIEQNKLQGWDTFEIKSFNEIIQLQNQTETQVFEKMIGLLTNFIEKSSINVDEKTIIGYSIAKKLCGKILINLQNEMYHFGRIILNNDFRLIQSLYPRLISKVIEPENGLPAFCNVDEFLYNMEQRDSNDRWEYLKFYLNGLTYETPEKRKVMDAIGSVFFYKSEFNRRKHFYNEVIYYINKDYGDFTLQYLHFIENILDLISKSVNPIILKDKLNSLLSPYDCLLLLYNVLGNTIKPDFIRKIYIYIDFQKIIKFNLRSLMIDSPSDAEIEKEIEFGFPETEVKMEEK